MPIWAVSPRFNHFYKLGVNTRLPATEAGKALHVGHEMRIL